jgi:DNA-binding NarL/FixJ family response regulator
MAAASVLVVDDDPAFLDVAKRVLEAAGVRVVATAEDAASALAAALEVKPDAALVDVDLPDRNGIELARDLGALPWPLRVVLTSSDPDAVSSIARDGLPPFVPKEDLPNAPLISLLQRD